MDKQNKLLHAQLDEITSKLLSLQKEKLPPLPEVRTGGRASRQSHTRIKLVFRTTRSYQPPSFFGHARVSLRAMDLQQPATARSCGKWSSTTAARPR